MERREDSRFPTDYPVEFVILGGDRQLTPGVIKDVSESGLRMSTADKLRAGAFVRLHIDDTVLFGEIRYSCPWMGGYLAGLYVERMLVGGSEVSTLLALALPECARVGATAASMFNS